MAKILRKTLQQFGLAGPTSSFGQFGSKEAGVPQTSQDPDVIQQLAAWDNGWQDAVVTANKAAYLEDMNGWCYVHSYMAAYILQQGIPEWDSGTTYYQNSVVQTNSGQWFNSLQDNSLGNTPPVSASDAFWQWVNPPQDLVGAATLNKVPKVTDTTPSNGVPGSVTLGDSAITDDGVNVGISLPLKFPDTTVQSTAAQPVSVQSVVTGSRSFSTSYQNTSGKPMFVSVGAALGGGPFIEARVDAVITPTTKVALGSFGATPSTVTIFFIVLPGYYYIVLSNAGAPDFWVEWT